MGRKRARYKLSMTSESLSLADLDRIYQVVTKALPIEIKDSLVIEVDDIVGGTHNIYEETGKMPNGIFCPRCLRLSCADCPRYVLDGNQVIND